MTNQQRQHFLGRWSLTSRSHCIDWRKNKQINKRNSFCGVLGAIFTVWAEVKDCKFTGWLVWVNVKKKNRRNRPCSFPWSIWPDDPLWILQMKKYEGLSKKKKRLTFTGHTAHWIFLPLLPPPRKKKQHSAVLIHILVHPTITSCMLQEWAVPRSDS